MEVRVWGVVQGVGFRPFVYRLARELDLTGWVRNDGAGVVLEVEGEHEKVLSFLERLPKEKPPPAFIHALEHRFLTPRGYTGFEIRESERTPPRVWVLPDLAICKDCLKELLDPEDRRYHYPFLNCTYCGPRFSIIEDLPYDRSRTSMKHFKMCSDCAHEYHNPADRRFHAQPTACPACGPKLMLWDRKGGKLAEGEAALGEAVKAILEGKILALKGLGGFHLIVDAASEEAVAELRRRKRRPFKAFALMYPSLEKLKRHVCLPSFAEPILTSPQAPILLLPRTEEGEKEVAPSVAPGSPYLGVMLPYTPLHVLLLSSVNRPVVATSGNLSDEPIVYDETEALERLGEMADLFLVHDRPIVRHVDDSVLHTLERPRPQLQMLRRARGYAPLPFVLPRKLPSILALGGHLNVTLALARGREVFLSQHLGDMESFEGQKVYRRTLEDFLRLYRFEPELVVHDLHPDYFTTHLAREMGCRTLAVQHHHAHLAACMAENRLEGEVLGVTWDGTGYGPDGTVWGGEILLGDASHFERMATLHPFRLAGGERAIKEPWRVALALLREAFEGEIPQDIPLFRSFPGEKIRLILEVLHKGINSPVTTSVGRLFDGVSALLGISYENSHQAQAAQLLEYAAWRGGSDVPPFTVEIAGSGPLRFDWREMVREIVRDLRTGVPAEILAARFHRTLVEFILEIAHRAGVSRVLLCGGVFANRWLTEAALVWLEKFGLQGYIHTQLPPTDGSLSLGQIWVAAHQI